MTRAREIALGVLLGVLAATPLAVFAAWTTPRTWTTSELVTASIMNTHIRDNLDYLKGEMDDREKVLSITSTAVSSTGDPEEDLMSYSVPGATLANNGERLIVHAAGRCAADTDGKILKLVYGSTTLYTSNTYCNDSGSHPWEFTAVIIRTGATAQRAATRFYWHGGGGAGASIVALDSSAPAETLSGAVTVKVRADGVNASDVTQDYFEVRWAPVP